MNARQKLDVEVDRGGQTSRVKVTPRAVTKYDIGDVGLFPAPPREPRLVTVTGGDPADARRPEAGDVIVSIGGTPIRGVPEEILTKFVEAIEPVGARAVPDRATCATGSRASTQVTPRRDPDGSWKVGVSGRAPICRRSSSGSRRARPSSRDGGGSQTDFRTTLAILGRLFRAGEHEDDVRARSTSRSSRERRPARGRSRSWR